MVNLPCCTAQTVRTKSNSTAEVVKDMTVSTGLSFGLATVKIHLLRFGAKLFVFRFATVARRIYSFHRTAVYIPSTLYRIYTYI